jgi:cobaltochelatase CobN
MGANGIVLMSHADSDLLMLARSEDLMPQDFPFAAGVNLQSIQSEEKMQELFSSFANARVFVARILGRSSTIPGFTKLLNFCKEKNIALIVVSGTGDLDPELACMSTVSPNDLQDVMNYFRAGGVANLAQMMRMLSDRFMLTGFGYEPPKPLVDHGIYHPKLKEGTGTFAQWQKLATSNKPTIGIVFYRAHWMSGNTDFIDAVVNECEKRGMNALPVFTSSLRATEEPDASLPAAFEFFRTDGKTIIDILINTTSFALADVNPSGPTLSGWAATTFSQLDVPLLQAMPCATTLHVWQESRRGLTPLDTAMNVVMPEFDGKIVTVPFSFKSKHPSIDAVVYEPLQDRVERIVGLAERFCSLKYKPNSKKKVAFVLTNSNSKASQIGNAVGLDAPESLMRLIEQLRSEGYKIDLPFENGTALIHELIDRCSYDTTMLSGHQCDRAVGQVTPSQYSSWFKTLPERLQTLMCTQWGNPPGEAYTHRDNLIVAGIELGNAVVVLQPPRGYGMDPNAIYHQPDLPPTHHYFAVYRWLTEVFGADAIVHVGKHGTLEWLPGKGVGLSQECFPDAILGDVPLIYPFILNDPGEGSQAKRRSHAVIVDHLTPPMTTAETYGVIAELTQLVDEYYQVELLDPNKLPLLQKQIWELMKKSNLDKDLDLILNHDHDEHEHGQAHDHEHGHDHLHDHEEHDHSHEHDHDEHNHVHLHKPHDHDEHDHDDDDHDHDHDHHHHDHEEMAPHGVPVTIAEMDSVAVSHFLQDIDGYLCELGLAQIRDGLHTLGQEPQGNALVDMLASLTRLPNLDVPSLQAGMASFFGLNLKDMLEHPGKRLDHVPDKLQKAAEQVRLHANSDVLELFDRITKQIYRKLQESKFDSNFIGQTLREIFDTEDGLVDVQTTLRFACDSVVSNLAKTSDEITNIVRALDGKYVPPGPSGSPTRGMAHILPTGKNFYSVDPRSLPSHSAWVVGQQLAIEVLKRHLSESGTYPETVGISVWGTSAMRTHGDDVAEILALLGVRPVWQSENRRLSGVEVIPLSELKRPRIDVTVRISGFFRDAFQHLIELIDDAVAAVINLDEPPDQNYVRKHFLADIAKFEEAGQSDASAARQCSYRIFGSKPGSYGAGILPLINEGNWQNQDDFAEAYVNWGGYAYAREYNGTEAKDAFRHRLGQVEIALHNQDNREHDIFDSDDYLQFHGGMIATIRSLSGRKPKHYFGDTNDPSRAKVRDLKEEALRVFRSRVVNPKWIKSIQKHGYKGGLELTATVDYFFGYDATASIMDDWMYEDLAQNYALDEEMRQFLKENNPWAMNAIAERLIEAADRKMWKNPDKTTMDQLRKTYLDSETHLEERSENQSFTKVQV